MKDRGGCLDGRSANRRGISDGTEYALHRFAFRHRVRHGATPIVLGRHRRAGQLCTRLLTRAGATHMCANRVHATTCLVSTSQCERHPRR
jgi:hypothetical protein